MAGATPVPGGPSPQSLDAHGTTVTLEFDKYVPELTGDQVRALLAPVIDFKALTPAEAYEKTLPPKVQEAIKNHKVLVGMDKEMVTYAKGRPQQRIRDKDEQGQDYEEWIYGTPPEEVDFVRFKGNEVARLEIMTVDGQKIVRTEKEVELPSKETEVAEQKPSPKPPDMLRRCGGPGRNPNIPTTPVRPPYFASAGPECASRRQPVSRSHWDESSRHCHRSSPTGGPPTTPTGTPPHVLPAS